MARHTRSGVHGMSTCRTPSCESASTTAFCTAGVAPTVAASPVPSGVPREVANEASRGQLTAWSGPGHAQLAVLGDLDVVRGGLQQLSGQLAGCSSTLTAAG